MQCHRMIPFDVKRQNRKAEESGKQLKTNRTLQQTNHANPKESPELKLVSVVSLHP